MCVSFEPKNSRARPTWIVCRLSPKTLTCATFNTRTQETRPRSRRRPRLAMEEVVDDDVSNWKLVMHL